MFNCLCINDLFALQRYKNFWTFLLFPLCFKALSTIYLQVGNFSFTSCKVLYFSSVILLPSRIKDIWYCSSILRWSESVEMICSESEFNLSCRSLSDFSLLTRFSSLRLFAISSEWRLNLRRRFSRFDFKFSYFLTPKTSLVTTQHPLPENVRSQR